MEGDRLNQLRARAVFHGHIDYTDFDPTDPKQIYREALALEQTERELVLDILRNKIQYRSSGATSYAMGDTKLEITKDHLEELNRLSNMFGALSLPWETWAPTDTSVDSRVQAAMELQDRWEQKFGKIDTPEMQERLAELEEKLEDQPLLPTMGAQWLS